MRAGKESLPTLSPVGVEVRGPDFKGRFPFFETIALPRDCHR